MILLSQLAPSDHLLGNEKQAADHLISRHIGINPVSVSALAICHSSLRSWQVEHHQHRFQG
jgi:hypothetical protein